MKIPNTVFNFFKQSAAGFSPWLVHALLITFWIVLHAPVIFYGTSNVPFHTSYIGDEQSPVTGALHIAQSKSLLAIYDLHTLYYGPLFAIVALPAVVGDFAIEAIRTGVYSSEAYKMHVLYDWGGILVIARLIALVVGYVGLCAVYQILMTTLVNPQRSRVLAAGGALLLATNFYFFEYSSFLRHWIFIMVPLLWQLFFLIRIYENPRQTNRYFLYQSLLAAAAFGISYVSAISQIFLLPLFIAALYTHNKELLKGFLRYSGFFTVFAIVLVAWHPYEVLRYLSIFSGDILRTGQNEYSVTDGETVFSFSYYLQVIFINNAFLILALGLLLYGARNLPNSIKIWLYSCTVVGGLYFLLTGVHSIHVSRYALPTIIMLTVMVAVLGVRLFPQLSRSQRTVVVVLLSFHILYHVVSMGFWLQMMHAGPPEEKYIASLLDAQEKYPTAGIAVMTHELFAWPHTIESYRKYADTFNLSDRPQFQGYFNATSPNMSLLSVSYVINKEDLYSGDYEIVMDCHNPYVNGSLQDDYPEVILVRLWGTDYTWNTVCALQL